MDEQSHPGPRKNVLHPFSKLPELNTAVILLVGCQAIDTKTLARSLVDLSTDVSLQVRTATSLPLPPENDDQRPKIDLVVFLLDASVKMSMKVIADSVGHLDMSYFIGRVCFVVLNASSEQSHCADIGDIVGLCDTYNSPMLTGNLEPESQRQSLARRLLEMTWVAAGFKPGVSPLLIQCTRRSYQFAEVL
ncbi:centromere protein M-like [Diadema antillarum]|uniref:centromere protein M-like n=1 Tax=Diadema antillarum TaxID=105358 RepID=UPI003A8518A3